MPSVASAMRVRVKLKVRLRPIRSPKWAISTPPTGRAKYPTANTVKV